MEEQRNDVVRTLEQFARNYKTSENEAERNEADYYAHRYIALVVADKEQDKYFRKYQELKS